MFNFFRKKDKAREKQVETEDPRHEAVAERGRELAEVSRKREEAGIPQYAESQEDLTTVMYVFTEQWDYAIFRAGIDVPLHDDGSVRATLKEDRFLQLSEGIHIHVSQLKAVDLDKLEVEISFNFDRNMRRNLRADDVIEKLQSLRKGDSTYFRIDSAFVEEMRKDLER
ncbi:hypothetical protein [Sphingobacterium haloxyli]|uniref:Uncharacterized protein n=1 Tax=Sphingobacterium haloxyli TaxID=2100533 RepID=A0A2S9IUA5_9SPHI|nr:hypothetical protein [Sphingobacterium haloxyli]PRD44117.1 hypothetical protein C5745_19635 [Sphingobacterium haloxyli]